MNLDGLFINQRGRGGRGGSGPAFSGRANIQRALVIPLCAVCRRNKASQFLYNRQNITEKVIIFDYTFNSKWTQGFDLHFCHAELCEILLIAQQSTFLKCCLKNTTHLITINLNSQSVQVLYQLCMQDSQNMTPSFYLISAVFHLKVSHQLSLLRLFQLPTPPV